MNNLQSILRKFMSKFPFKIWKIYILKKEVINFLLKNPTFKFKEIRKFILFTIEAPNNKSIISADPFLHDHNTVLFESISKLTGYGQIYKFNISEKRNERITLPNNQHFSFPRTKRINNKIYLTCESGDSKGLCIYEIDDNISIIKKLNIADKSEDLKYHIIDPIIDFKDEKILLYCTTIEFGNKSLVLFESSLKKNLEFKLLNIIKLNHDVKESSTLRLGGILDINNKILISTQNQYQAYGSSLNLINLDIKTYKKISLIKKSNILTNFNCKDFLGPHTINSLPDSQIIVIDLASYSWISSFWKLIHFFYKNLISKLYYLILNNFLKTFNSFIRSLF